MNSREEQDKFYQQFHNDIEEIQNYINELRSKKESKYTSSQVDELILPILLKIQKTQDSVTSFCQYLTLYDQKIYQEEINTAKLQVEELKAQLKPKGKFSFKKRDLVKSEVKLDINSNINNVRDEKDVDGNMFCGFVDNVLIFKNISSQILAYDTLNLKSVDINEATAQLTNIKDSIIELFSNEVKISTVYINNLTNCVIVLPPLPNSVLIQNCSNCSFYVACHQFRIHKTNKCDIYLHVTSKPIIEDCQELGFSDYNINNGNLEKWFKSSGLSSNPESNLYKKVEDFNWLKQTKSPNWYLISEGNEKVIVLDDLKSKLKTFNFSISSFMNNYLPSSKTELSH